MKVMLGLGWLVAVGCVARPHDSLPTPLAEASAIPLPPTWQLRIGVEDLPPDPGDEPAPRIERPQDRVRSGGAAPRDGRAQDPVRLEGGAQALAAAAMAREERTRNDDPVAQHTRLFLADLLAADSRRVRRQAALPFFDYAPLPGDPLFLLPAERELRLAQQQWTDEHGLQLFQRPLEQLARRLPLVRQLELDLRDAQRDSVPLAPSGSAPRSTDSLGHLSLRLRPHTLQDPVEVVWVLGGLRIGSSRTAGKFSWELPLGDRLLLELHARSGYGTGGAILRADLAYRYSDHTTWHLAAGNNMAFVATSGPFALFDAPMAGQPGVVLYVVHLF